MDGLRALAACSVVVHHVGLYAMARGTTGHRLADEIVHQLAAGVLLFFTLSGLLLYGPFAAAIAGHRTTPSMTTFGRNRGLRILPAYWVILIVAALAGATVTPHPEEMLRTGNLLEHPAGFLANALLVQGYAPSTLLTGIGPAWTLVIEVGFYATLPIVCAVTVAVARRAPRRRHLLVFLPPATFLAVGLAGRAVAAAALDGDPGWSRTWPSVLVRSFVANADLFAAGMTVAAVATLVASGDLRLPTWWRTASILGATLAAALALLVPNGEFTVARYDQLGALAAAFAIAPLALDPDASRARRVLEWRPLAALGLASYSLYLWHQPVIDWLRARGVLPLDGLAGLSIAVATVSAISVLLSAITYLAVEAPALRRKRPAQARTATLAEHAPAVSHTE